MKIGDYIYTAYYYADQFTGWPKHIAAQGMVVSFDENIAIIQGRRPIGWFRPKILFKASKVDCFDNHYDRDKRFKY